MNGAVECRSALKCIFLKSFMVDAFSMSKYILSSVVGFLATDFGKEHQINLALLLILFGV